MFSMIALAMTASMEYFIAGSTAAREGEKAPVFLCFRQVIKLQQSV